MKIERNQLIETIRKVKLAVDIDKLDDQIPLVDQGVDSLDFSGILFGAEEDFNIQIPEEDVEKVKSINDLLIYINSKL